ncbi:hypothetical protein [Haloplanus halobius]|uniref:hypothetical protein n=1 Tax=Haloplanus halobius TaxID=2934938 RepID=UPI00201068D6|nr:hypothetical protein [Haloplanus sp. XH21]
MSLKREVKTLFETDGSVQQAGLIGDETARTKFTVWTKSDQPTVRKGERMRIRAAKVS